MKKNLVIAIERQYGSGGRSIGILLSRQLGIPWYDKELSGMAAEKSGINEGLFIDADETLEGAALRLGKGGVYKGETVGPESPHYASRDNLFNLQADVLKDLAKTQSCIIIGRCANFVLRDYENVVSVFVHAPMDFLMEQAALKQYRRGKELEKYILKTNKNRAVYYKYYSGEEWSDALYYDLCLDSRRLGFEKCAEEIKSYIRVRYGEDALEGMA